MCYERDGGSVRGVCGGGNLMFRHMGHWLLVNESFIPLRLSSAADTLWLPSSFAAYCLPDNKRSIKSSSCASQEPQECHQTFEKKQTKTTQKESAGAGLKMVIIYCFIERGVRSAQMVSSCRSASHPPVSRTFSHHK